MANKRSSSLLRRTRETCVKVQLGMDASRPGKIKTTIPFMDHMLTLFAHHAGFSLAIAAKGDTEIDDHHLVEDMGITLGQALARAWGDKKGITRYGNFLLPMDEALAYIALDLSGRPYLQYEVNFGLRKAGFDYDLLHEFFQALVANAGMTLHVSMLKGRNNHHMAEAIFKGFGRALAQAVSVNAGSKVIPSTKGLL